MMIGRMGGQNTGINIAAMNRSIAHKNEAMTGKKQEDKIVATISPMGKKQSMVQQLMKQKQDLTDRMNSLSASDGESGVSMQEQMKEYQKQMKALDEQILKLQTPEEDEKVEDQESGIYEKPMTKEEAENKKMNDIMSLASSSSQVEVIDSVKEQMDGRANVLKSEIKSGNGNIEVKLEEVAEIESKSADLASQMGQKMTDISNDLRDIEEEAIEEEKVAQSDSKEEDVDPVKQDV